MSDTASIHIINELLGPPGRLLSASKSAYEIKFPDHKIFFNACLFVGDEQVWHGDIDFDLDTETVQTIANITGKLITVTREWPFRFEGLAESRKGRPEAVVEFYPETNVSV